MNPQSNRINISKVLFDTFNVPSLCFGTQPFLSLFSTSKTTGNVIESGDSITQSACLYEGYSISSSYLRYNVGGKTVTEYLQMLLRRMGYHFISSSDFEIVKQMKEMMCYTMIPNENEENVNKLQNVTESKFYLPDGKSITLKDEKVYATEIIFDPSLIGMEYLPLHEMAIKSICNVDIDLRKVFYDNIILCGGNTLFKGMHERMNIEIKKHMSNNNNNMNINITLPPYRKHSCWIGGSVISSLNTFKKLLITKQEWNEQGNKIVHIKSI